MPGAGTMTPVTPGIGVLTGLGWIRPLPYTLLSLPRYAQIMGISPAHFMRATAELLATPVFPMGSCGSLWPRHSWQNFDQVSHEELAYAIQSAEEDIAEAVGYWPAPMWVAEEGHEYPKFFSPGYYDLGIDARGNRKSVQSRYGKIVNVGRRAATLVGKATTAGASLVYLDMDSDGLYETARITLATSLTNTCEIKLYYDGFDGEQEWEIRPIRSIDITGGNVVIYVDAWLLIKPELLGALPTSNEFRAIDISTTVNYVTTVEVYRVYSDATQASAVFYWEPENTCTICGGTGCSACVATTQNGCLHSRSDDIGFVVPTPASYDVTQGWVVESWSGCIEPGQVKIWYYAGERGDRYLRGLTCDPLSDWWAQTIAWMATARLERPLCGCNNVQAVAEHLAIDMAVRQAGSSSLVTFDQLRNPFGTRRGEIMAWKRVSKLVRKRPRYAAV